MSKSNSEAKQVKAVDLTKRKETSEVKKNIVINVNPHLRSLLEQEQTPISTLNNSYSPFFSVAPKDESQLLGAGKIEGKKKQKVFNNNGSLSQSQNLQTPSCDVSSQQLSYQKEKVRKGLIEKLDFKKKLKGPESAVGKQSEERAFF
jgi:hypothetical protein